MFCLNIISIFFYDLLTVHPCTILLIKPTWCTIFLSISIYFLYMFRVTICPSSGETTVFMQQLVLVILYGCLVCRVEWNSIPPCIPDSHPYRI